MEKNGLMLILLARAKRRHAGEKAADNRIIQILIVAMTMFD